MEKKNSVKIKGEYLKGFGCSTGFVNHETILKKRLINFIVSKLRALFVKKIFIYLSAWVSAKECSNYHTTALISHASKVMLKIPQARLQQYVNHELPDVQAGFVCLFVCLTNKIVF